jgi:hypothetical protein
VLDLILPYRDGFLLHRQSRLLLSVDVVMEDF